VTYDVFLSYNRQDQDAVLEVRRKLELRGIRTFLDRDNLAAGLPWPQALEQALQLSRAVAVFPGPHDLGTWQKREMFFALDLQANAERENRKFPVIPVLLKNAQRRLRSPAWDAIAFTPGDNPRLRLASALVPLLEPDLSEVTRIAKAGELATALAQRNGVLAATLIRALDRTHGSDRLLLIVDQFEEFFTLAPKPEDLQDDKAKGDIRRQVQERSEFLEDLLASTRSAPVTILITLRADYYSHALNTSALSDALNSGQIALGPMLREELRSAIENPARLVGLKFDPGLVSRMLNDVDSAPGNLPLLEYALTQLWGERRNGILTSDAYEGFGGLTGAIGDKAEGIYSNSPRRKRGPPALYLGAWFECPPQTWKAPIRGSEPPDRKSGKPAGKSA
jgi:hypothetical protein